MTFCHLLTIYLFVHLFIKSIIIYKVHNIFICIYLFVVTFMNSLINLFEKSLLYLLIINFFICKVIFMYTFICSFYLESPYLFVKSFFKKSLFISDLFVCKVTICLFVTNCLLFVKSLFVYISISHYLFI